MFHWTVARLKLKETWFYFLCYIFNRSKWSVAKNMGKRENTTRKYNKIIVKSLCTVRKKLIDYEIVKVREKEKNEREKKSSRNIYCEGNTV